MTHRPRVEALPLALVLAASLVVATVWFQGWKERLLNNLDTIIFYQQAWGLIHGGQIPDHGQIYSYGSYSPPGVAYLIAPGMLLSADPRLYEVPLTVALYLGSVTLAYFLGRLVGGARTGAVSAIALAVSRLGQRDINDMQFFVIATMYFGCLWAIRRRPAALAVSLFSFAAGLCVKPNILPFGLALPILWAAYRPTVNWKSLVVVLIAAAAIWFPYLRFEEGRHFVDIRSYVLREPVVALQGSSVSTTTYCFAALEGESDTQNETYLPYLGLPSIAKRVVSAEPSGIGTVRNTLCSLALKIGRNFNNDMLLFGNNQVINASLLALFWTGMVALVTSSLMRTARNWPVLGRLVQLRIPGLIILLASGAAILFLALSPGWIATCCTADGKLAHASLLVVEQMQSLLPMVWVSLVLGLYLASHAGEKWKGLGALGILVVVPFAVLVAVSETARADRFWWMWPAQLIVVAVAIGLIAEQTRWPRAVFAGLSVVLIVLTINRPFYQAKLSDWLANGYAGKSTGQIETVDFLGEVARARGLGTLTVGYQLLWPRFTSENMVDPSYRTGTWFDFLLETREGVQNANRTVEGLSNNDEFRVVEIGQGPAPGQAPWPGFQFVEHFGGFEVFRRF